MAESRMLVFEANPQKATVLTRAEENLARDLFANFDSAWDHPALQSRLRQARSQPGDSASTLNSMTLFGVIWSSSKRPEFQKSQVVWKAMRVELENHGVLPRLVLEFNAYVTRNGKAHWRGKEQSTEVQGPLGHSISTAWKDHEKQRRTRGTKSVVNSFSEPPPAKFFVRERSLPPLAPETGSSTTSSSSSSFMRSSKLSQERHPSYNGQQELVDQRQFSHSSFPHPDLRPHSSLSPGSGAPSVPAQINSIFGVDETRQPQTFDQTYPSIPGIQYKHERLAHSHSLYPSSPFGPNSLPRETQRAATYGVISGPSNLTSTRYMSNIPQSDSFSSQAYQTDSLLPPMAYSSFSSPSFNPTTAYNPASVLPQVDHRNDYNLQSGNEYARNRYESTQNENGQGFEYGAGLVHNSDYGDGRAVFQSNWSVDESVAFEAFCASYDTGSSSYEGNYQEY
ncbi:hypothetical protein F5050DRAFT_429435 [Lentinula boryana]|uniref:Uncharacterized protein n=1 Tax=Lentinula boryana TaxID=40481 RepID=A0ABQ8Q840_9AGAR|nr:hypothetical protein F5050DRAFT_429435 [Lentinula boryana]